MEVVGQWFNQICIFIIVVAAGLWTISAILLKLPTRGRLALLAQEAVPFSLKPAILMSAAVTCLLLIVFLAATRGKPFGKFSNDQILPPLSFKMTESVEPDYRAKKSGKYLHLAVTSVKAAGLEILSGYSDNEGQGILMVVTPEEAEQVKRNLQLTPGKRFSFPGLPPQLLSKGAAKYLRENQVSLFMKTMNTVLSYFGIIPLLLALLPLSLILLTYGTLAFGNTLLHKGLRRNLVQILDKKVDIVLAPIAMIESRKTWLKRSLPLIHLFSGRNNLDVVTVETNKGKWSGVVLVPSNARGTNASGRLLFVPSGLPLFGRHPVLLTNEYIEKALTPV